MSDNNPVLKVSNVHLAIGVDFLGSKTSFVSGRNYDLEATPLGIKIHSKASGRTVTVPYPNVKAFEHQGDAATANEGRSTAANRTKAALEEARSRISDAQLAKDAEMAAREAAPVLSDEEQKEMAAEARLQARKKARDEAAAKLIANPVEIPRR